MDVNKFLKLGVLSILILLGLSFSNIQKCSAETSCVPSDEQEQRIFDAAINVAQLAGYAVDRDKVREEIENIQERQRRDLALEDGSRVYTVNPLIVNVLHHGEGVTFTNDDLIRLDGKGAVEMEIYANEAGESAVTLIYRHSPVTEVTMIGTMDINETRHQVPSQASGGDLSFTKNYNLLKGRNRVILRAADVNVSFYPLEIIVGKVDISAKLATVDLSNKRLVIDVKEEQVGEGLELKLLMERSIEGDVFFRVGDENSIRTPVNKYLLEFRFADDAEYKSWSNYQDMARYMPLEFVKRTSVQYESNVINGDDMLYFLYVVANLEASPTRGYFRIVVPRFAPGGPKSSNEVELSIE